jgi:hypothetical protein
MRGCSIVFGHNVSLAGYTVVCPLLVTLWHAYSVLPQNVYALTLALNFIQ